MGGGITADNASRWLSHGADKVIVTSWLFPDGQLSMDRVRQVGYHVASFIIVMVMVEWVQMSSVVGKERLVVDLSCRRGAGAQTWFVGMFGAVPCMGCIVSKLYGSHQQVADHHVDADHCRPVGGAIPVLQRVPSARGGCGGAVPGHRPGDNPCW